MSDSEEDTDISESELESYAESCYDQLMLEGKMVKVSEDSYHCPYCCGKKRQSFSFNSLLQHASGVSQGSSRRGIRDRGNHLGLKKYMQNAINGESSSGIIVDKDECVLNEIFVWPWVGVMANISVGESGSKLRDELTKKGFNPVKVNPLWNFNGHSGYAVVEFKTDFLGLFDALRFEKAYEACHQGKREYCGISEKGDKIYCWVARDDDFHSQNKIGDYLQKNGNLKTIEQYHTEEKNKNNRQISKLTNTVEIQNMHIRDIETKYKETCISLCRLTSEKDEMVQAFDKERQELQKKVRENMVEWIEQQSVALKVQNESLRLRLRLEMEQIERAILEQKRREKEELQRKIINLEKELNVIAKQGDEKKEEVEHLEELSQALVVKDRLSKPDLIVYTRRAKK